MPGLVRRRVGPTEEPPVSGVDEIVVSGLGLISPLACGVDQTWRRVLARHSAVRRCTEADLPMEVIAPVSCTLPDNLHDLDRAQAFAVLAAREAIDDARLSPADLRHERTGWTIGFSKGTVLSLIRHNAHLHRGDAVSARRVLGYGPGAALSEVVARLGGGGGPLAGPVLACATGLASVLQAARWVKLGLVDRVIAGAAEASICPLVSGAFASMGAFARCDENDPSRSCKPFSADRSGFVMGEGAGVLVVERGEAARRRGAMPWAVVHGGVTGMVADHVVQSDTTGRMIATLIDRCLSSAGVGVSEIDYVHAHGTGTVQSDLAELNALARVFDRQVKQPPIGSTKAATGHLLGAAGAAEAALVCLALRDGVLPPTLNLDKPDEACRFDAVPDGPRKAPLRRVLKLSAGFGGCGAALVLGRGR